MVGHLRIGMPLWSSYWTGTGSDSDGTRVQTSWTNQSPGSFAGGSYGNPQVGYVPRKRASDPDVARDSR